MFCGPRDQYETWQALPSATPANRYFGFSHILDGGWTGHHYCRSWELLGLQQFGPIVNVDKAAPPYSNTRRLITGANVKNDARRAHSSVVPGKAAVKDASGKFVHEDVWRYLFTHPVDESARRCRAIRLVRSTCGLPPCSPRRVATETSSMRNAAAFACIPLFWPGDNILSPV